MGELQVIATRARELRSNPTDTERALWRHLRLRQIGGYKFRRQRPIGPYIIDFVCLEKHLVVEVDGGQHQQQRLYDASRDSWLRGEGFTVLRFWDDEVLKQVENVKQAIWEALCAPLFNSPPRRGEED